MNCASDFETKASEVCACGILKFTPTADTFDSFSGYKVSWRKHNTKPALKLLTETSVETREVHRVLYPILSPHKSGIEILNNRCAVSQLSDTSVTLSFQYEDT